MTIYDWLFIGLLALAAATGLLSLNRIFLAFRTSRKRRKLLQLRPKNGKKKRWQLQKRQLLKRQQQHLLAALLLAFTTVICSGSAYYGQHYQATNLGDADAANIANGYRLLISLEQEFHGGDETDKKRQLDLDALAKRFSSYGTKRASGKLTEEGQIMLNRYYSQMTQLGQNINQELGRILTDQPLKDSFLADIENVTGQQQQILIYYQIEESSLTSE